MGWGASILLMLLICIAMIIAIMLFSWAVRRMLGTGQRNWFGYDHVNERHKRIEWKVRWFFIGTFIVTAAVTMATGAFENRPWYLEIWWQLLVFLVVINLLKAFMEFKYEENRRASVATLAETIFDTILLGSALMTGFYGAL
jgi:preprotein translocase subunit SecG